MDDPQKKAVESCITLLQKRKQDARLDQSARLEQNNECCVASIGPVTQL